MVNVSVGLLENQTSVEVELLGSFRDSSGKDYAPARHRFTSEQTLVPSDFSSSFAVDGMTIGIGFHWQREERQVFRGAIRIIRNPRGLTLINDVPLEEYVASVISSEMSASCPLELLKAHAVISRSWLRHATAPRSTVDAAAAPPAPAPNEIVRWYGREAHADFDVCADDHCQRYQGITKAFSPAAAEAVRATSGEVLLHGGSVCDARFSKCCGGITERYWTAWEDRDIPYLRSVYDGPAEARPYTGTAEAWIRTNPPAYCNAEDADLIARILPGFDQETRDFFRWIVEYTAGELGELVQTKLGVDLGPVTALEPLARGPSGRILRLKITGSRSNLIVGKELEIRRALSASHLYSSAFVADQVAGRFLLRGAGWGHGVGLCQIGAAVLASQGKTYRQILGHYYPGTETKEITSEG